MRRVQIVIYYDTPAAEVMAMLRDWTDFYCDMWLGLIVTPMPGIGESVVLTAWTRRLSLGRLELAAAAAFIDADRGRGSKNPVR